MLKPQKKIDRKEIKEDKLVSTYFKLNTWIDQNKRIFYYIISSPFVIAFIWFIWSQKKAEANENATAKLGKIIAYYDEGRYQEAIYGIPQQGLQGLQGIVDEHGNTESGEYAKLFLANAYYAVKNYDKALEYYDDVSIKDKMLTATALAGVASCYEIKGDYVKAAAYFEKAAFKNMTQLLAPEYLQKSAINYGLSGQKEKAVELLQTIKKEFPNSQEAYQANLYISQFSN